MARLYHAWEGKTPVRNKSFADVSLDRLIEDFGLKRSHWGSSISDVPPTFRGESSKPELDDFRGITAALVRITESDVVGHKEWRPGWYLIPIAPAEVMNKL